MGKQRKKSISSLNRALGTAANFPSLAPEKFKEYLSIFRKEAKETKEGLGFVNGINKAPINTKEAVNNRLRYLPSDQFVSFFTCCRSLLLGEWDRNRRVYTVSPEAEEYIKESFPVERMGAPLDDYIKAECEQPFYVEFPGSNFVKGAFIGTVAFGNEKTVSPSGIFPTEENPLQIMMVLLPNETMIYAHLCSGVPTYSFFEQDDSGDREKPTPEQLFLMRVLVYIAYMKGQNDADGRIFLPKSVQGAKEAYLVKEGPEHAFFPEAEDPSTWIAQGMCAWLRYLNRENMVKDFTEKMAQFSDRAKTVFSGGGSQEQIDALEYMCWKTVLDWEKYRVVYQFDKKTGTRLVIECLDDVLLYGFSPSLLQYMPHETVVIFDRDEGEFALITRCAIADYDKQGIFVLASKGDKAVATAFPAMRVVGHENYGTVAIENPNCVQALCVLYHVLQVFQKKALTKAVKDAVQAGDPNDTRLVPMVKPGERDREVYTGQDKELLYRDGYEVEDSPFELFEVTSKTVKRIRQEQKIARYGWKMTPHSRRPHPHRYWVGRGDQKHMEVRWLDRIQIHKDQKIETTTLHNVK